MPPPPSDSNLTLGVEEEFFVVDEVSGRLSANGRAVLAAARHGDADQLDAELSRSQVESGSAVCRTLDEVDASLRSLRGRLDVAARAVGSRLMASGTHPFSHWSEDGGVTPSAGYRYLEAMYGQLTDEQVVCGCHIHIGIDDPELAIQVMNRARIHLPVFIALSANSPFWLGEDTRYASYRTQIFHRWPTSGVPEPFTSRADYERLVADLHATQAIDQPARIYWDLRPSARYPTLELRAADVPMTVDESVALAGLARALVDTCMQQALAGDEPNLVRSEVLRAAVWRASRFGLDDTLVDPHRMTTAPARDVVTDLLQLLRPSLESRGEWDRVTATVGTIFNDGNGAARQLRSLAAKDQMGDVVAMIADRTVPDSR